MTQDLFSDTESTGAAPAAAKTNVEPEIVIDRLHSTRHRAANNHTEADRPIEKAAASQLQFNMTPRELAGCFAVTVAGLMLAHTVVQVARFALADDRLFGLVYMFSVGADGNIPTFYSGFALLFAAVMLAFTGGLIRKAKRPMSIGWFGLSLIFTFLAADEMLELHERLIEPVRGLLNASGAFYYAWIIPYAVAAAIIGVIYLKFLSNLPRRTAIGFVIAGTTFIGGAIGFEMLGGVFFEQAGSNSVAYVVAQTIEEALEMIGIVIFIYFIADYIVADFNSVAITLDKTD